MLVHNSDDHRADQQLQYFCDKHQLPAEYPPLAKEYFIPLAQELNDACLSNRPLLAGINGCQGSGKSTLADLLTVLLRENFGKVVANLSIDDFYLTKAKRQQMAKDIHPLFVTRGVPGTHDIPLLENTLKQLSSDCGWVHIPRFDKSVDDRRPEQCWDPMFTPVDIILLEGWCVGASPQSDSELFVPANDLEIQEDAEGLWRNTINLAIEKDYTPLFKRLDKLIMLQAPSFDCVYQWRQLQEDKLKAQTGQQNSGLMNAAELKRFIHHYQRLTVHMLQSLPQKANIVFTLNDQHSITGRKDNV